MKNLKSIIHLFRVFFILKDYYSLTPKKPGCLLKYSRARLLSF